jgi:transposase
MAILWRNWAGSSTSRLFAALAYSDGAKGGRPPYDPVVMLKVLVLAAQNNVSDARMEYLIRDRLSWLRFLGFDLGAPMPDADTIRLFREKLTDAGALDAVFPDLDRRLKERGYLAMGGQIVDATLVAAPKQRNTAPEKDAIKAGNTAGEIWRDEPARAAQKDTDARWTLKFAKAKPMADCKPGIEIAIARSRTASRWPSGAPRPAPPIRRSVPVSNMCSSGRKTRWAVHLHHRR